MHCPVRSTIAIMNPYSTPKVVSDDSNSRLKKSQPPKTVTISIFGILLTLACGVVKTIYTAFQREPLHPHSIGSLVGFLVGISILMGIFYVLLRGLYRGSKVAFWLIIGPSALTIICYKTSLNWLALPHAQWEKSLFNSQGIIQFLSAAILLHPQSWGWFHKKRLKVK
jgi:drug/metabolite transporter (DMT)-like permease